MSTMLGMLSKDSTLAIISIVCSQAGQNALLAGLMRGLADEKPDMAACAMRPVSSAGVPMPGSKRTEDDLLHRWRTDRTCSWC